MVGKQLRAATFAFATWVAMTTLMACFQLPLESEDAKQPGNDFDAQMGGRATPDGDLNKADAGSGGSPGGGTGGSDVGGAAGAGTAGMGGGGAAGAGTAGMGGGAGGMSACAAASKRCEGTRLEACDGQAWVLGDNCIEHGCNATRKECNQCTPNEVSCSAGTVYACSEGGLLSTTACTFGCIGNACRECLTDGDKKCNNNLLSTCTNGRWSAWLSCPNTQVCVAGQGCVCAQGTAAFGGECLRPVGNYDLFAYGGSMSPGYLGGQRVQLPFASTLRALGLVTATSAGTKVKMGLYRDNNGSPSTLVVETTATTLVAGRNHLSVASVALSAGAYWIAAIYDSSASLRQDLSTTSHRSSAHNFNSALPSNFSGSNATTAPAFNYYMLLD